VFLPRLGPISVTRISESSHRRRLETRMMLARIPPSFHSQLCFYENYELAYRQIATVTASRYLRLRISPLTPVTHHNFTHDTYIIINLNVAREDGRRGP
jgi:hypothetical protein